MQFELLWRGAGRRGQATEGSGGVANAWLAETGYGWPRLLKYSCNHCYNGFKGQTTLKSHINKNSTPIMRQVTGGVANAWLLETGYTWLRLLKYSFVTAVIIGPEVRQLLGTTLKRNQFWRITLNRNQYRLQVKSLVAWQMIDWQRGVWLAMALEIFL